MSDTPAAVWSAIAATFSALASFLIWRIHRHNLLDSVRPELVVLGWSRRLEGSGETSCDILSFSFIRNVGRGTAFNVLICGDFNRVTESYEVTGGYVPIIAPNETVQVNTDIYLSWESVREGHCKTKFLPIEVTLWSSDSKSMRHATVYHLRAMRGPATIIEGTEPPGYPWQVAPWVAVSERRTITRPVWILKCQTYYRSIVALPSKLSSRAGKTDKPADAPYPPMWINGPF
jgi:hypothetical protein